MTKKTKTYLSAYTRLISEWHPEKNEGRDPTKITHGSKKRVWWVCERGHEWEAVVYSRTISGTGCPYCAGFKVLTGETCLASKRPDLASEWGPANDKGPGEVLASSSYIATWVCNEYGHTWRTSVNNRSRGTGCPACTNKQVQPGFNCLTSQRPDLASEWSPKNSKGPGEVTVGSQYRATWVCGAYGHEWEAVVSSRTRGLGCPVCGKKKVLHGFNDLATTHPELVGEWSPMNEFGPETVRAGTHKRVWWVCGEGHEWCAQPKNRTLLGTGCPKCCLQQTSKPEGELFRLLAERFPGAEQSVRVGRWSVDVLLSEEKVVAEYDGSYFHKDNLDRDTRKTADLLERGYRVVRIREKSRQYTLPLLGIEDPRYLEVIYTLSRDWSGLSDVVDQITKWVGEEDRTARSGVDSP